METMHGAEHAAGGIISVTAKVAPPIAVTGMQFMGYAVADWVMLLTLLYTIVQLGLLLWDRFKKNGTRRNIKKSS